MIRSSTVETPKLKDLEYIFLSIFHIRNIGSSGSTNYLLNIIKLKFWCKNSRFYSNANLTTIKKSNDQSFLKFLIKFVKFILSEIILNFQVLLSIVKNNIKFIYIIN